MEIILEFEKEALKRVARIEGRTVCIIDYSWVNDSWFEESEFCVSKENIREIWEKIK